MSEPYSAGMITRILRTMADDRLAEVTPTMFQTWPTQRIVPTRIIAELIDAERSRRLSHGRAA